MSRLKKVKKANGQIIACNEVRVDADGHGAQSPSAHDAGKIQPCRWVARTCERFVMDFT
jgi:hypothetical protein